MIQSNPPRAEARRQAARDAREAADIRRAFGLAKRDDETGPSRAQRRSSPVEPGTGESPTSNRSNAPKRAARIRAQRRATRLARRHTR